MYPSIPSIIMFNGCFIIFFLLPLNYFSNLDKEQDGTFNNMNFDFLNDDVDGRYPHFNYDDLSFDFPVMKHFNSDLEENIMENFDFISEERPLKLPRVEALELNQDNKYTTCYYSRNVTKVMSELLKRFQRESGWDNGKFIDWDQVDRTEVPEKYDGIDLNRFTIRNKKLYSNPEIFDNVHFKPYTKEELVKKNENLMSYKRQTLQKQVSKAELENDEEFQEVYEELLLRFCLETGDSGANSINWRLIDKNRLLEKYKETLITDKLIYQMGLYKDAEFIENVHFRTNPKRIKW